MVELDGKVIGCIDWVVDYFGVGWDFCLFMVVFCYWFVVFGKKVGYGF